MTGRSGLAPTEIPLLMRPQPLNSAVSARMSAQRSLGTGPEMHVRRSLFAQGLRYRVGYPVPGMRRCSIDIAFPRAKVAVFVDGCFWHRCPQHRSEPKSNAVWWTQKLNDNEARDRRVDTALQEAGWELVRLWEHTPVDEAVDRVVEALRAAGVTLRVQT